jgi:hypothetical protein
MTLFFIFQTPGTSMAPKATLSLLLLLQVLLPFVSGEMEFAEKVRNYSWKPRVRPTPVLWLHIVLSIAASMLIMLLTYIIIINIINCVKISRRQKNPDVVCQKCGKTRKKLAVA